MNMRRTGIAAISVVVLLAGIAGVTFAQQNSLLVSSTRPVVDGVVQAGEYALTRNFDNQMTLYASRTEDTLYFAVVAPTDGWVAIGLGSKKMDGSTIFMGFVDTDGKPSFKTELGKGKRHVDAPADIGALVAAYAIKKADGRTTLEVAVKAEAFIKQGQAAIDLIFAMGNAANYTKYHNYRGSTSLALQ